MFIAWKIEGNEKLYVDKDAHGAFITPSRLDAYEFHTREEAMNWVSPSLLLEGKSGIIECT